MQKRKIIIGAYDTALDGQWTLSAWTLARAAAVENYADIPGHNGPLDLSTALTDGEPYYTSREFEAILESSEGTRAEREERINAMINRLDGWRANIFLPDDTMHYIDGRVRVEKLYNTPAHASVRVSATCDPWRYNTAETVVGLVATEAEQTASIINNGRCSVVPRVNITGGDVTLKVKSGERELTWALTPGEYIIADIYIKSGALPLTYSGTGQILLTYREAVL